MRPLTPALRLLLAGAFLLLLTAALLWEMTTPRWLGLRLVATAGGIQVQETSGPARGLVAPGSRLLALGSSPQAPGTPLLALEPVDLVEDPDTLPDYATVRRFQERQQQLSQQLAAPALTLQLASADGRLQQVQITPAAKRPLSSLPAAFWIQLAAGAGGFLMALWVLVLRPGELASRCFAGTGLGLMAAAYSAAVYSVRELALPAADLRWLGLLNHAGSLGFGAALLALFLVFPQPLLRARWLLLIPAIFLPWWLLDALQVWPSPAIGMYLPVLLQTVGILLFILLQWWRARGQPLHLASLRWLGLSSLMTAVLFVAVAAGPALLGRPPVMSQGHAFGLFLILYAGLALGLRRYRLFDLDRWSFHLLLWVGGGLILLMLDMALVMLLHLGQSLSLSLSLLVCGFLWLPLRGWLWRRLLARDQMDSHSLFRQVIQVALAPGDDTLQQRWQALLQDLYAPLEIRAAADSGMTPAILENGLQLYLPPTARSPAYQLSHAGRGRRLFNPEDARRAREVLDMLAFANANRDAYQQGAQQGAQEERSRIARDLHDDIGSRLLSSLHQSGLDSTRRTVQQAITEMRTIINGLTGTAMTLDDVLAELRHETSLRLEAAGIALDWPLPALAASPRLGYRVYRNYVAILREIVSNILRHSGAGQVRVDIKLEQGWLLTCVDDDGIGLQERSASPRQGMSNLDKRSRDLNGQLEFPDTHVGTRIRLRFPLQGDLPA